MAVQGGPQMIFHPGNCLNKKKPYAKECRLCIQYCPHDAIREDRSIDNAKCTDCGACMTVCPSDGFADTGMADLKDYLWESEEIVLHCPLGTPLGSEIPCIGIVDRDLWTVLTLWAEKKSVRIITGDCGACDDRQACVVSVGLFKEMIGIWPQTPKIKIEILPDTGELPLANQPSLRKNEKRPAEGRGLGHLRDMGKRKVKQLLPSVIAEESYAIPVTRQWLIEMLEKEPERKIPYLSVRVGEDCTNCSVCAKICPQGALQIIQKDGKMRHIYEGALCVQCQRCAEVCGPQTLRLEFVGLTHKYITGKILLKEGIPRYCAKCGIPIFHKKEPGLCMACAAKDPSLKGVLY